MSFKEHLNRIGFSEFDLCAKHFEFENAELMLKLEDNLYFYEKDRNTNTSFYCFDAENISDSELKEIRKKIWNQNKADLIIYLKNSSFNIIYVSSNPNHDPIVINDIDIPLNLEDRQLLDKISKRHIDTGALWLQYSKAVEKIKRQRTTVDKELINALKRLRKQLELVYNSHGLDAFNKRELVQALIDRTLFIKFLEDKKIINSYFFEDCFPNKNFHQYKEILVSVNATENLNYLFKRINTLFNSNLFKTPHIQDKDLLTEALNIIYHTLSGIDMVGQLRLFDFQFDVIPIEFISHIYQIFLDDEKAEKGIFYTPEGLVDLVLTKTLKYKPGKLLDCACGSGIFLVLALRKMLATTLEDKDIQKLITKRLSFIKEYIFGIEKEYTAWRLTIFSLYLEVLRDIKSEDLERLIKQNISNSEFQLFPVDFSHNILQANTLELDEDKQYFSNISFDYIVGNPPWFTIQNDNVEMLPYWNKYKNIFTLEKQASQCFLHKIKSWSHKKTRFGLIVNSSNFLNDSDKFQIFFYSNYEIERFYELSDLKDFLFGFAKEQATVVIFKNLNNKNNVIRFLKPQITPFTKVFKNVILKEDDVKEIAQSDLLSRKCLYRDYYINNIQDLNLVDKISHNSIKLGTFLIETKEYRKTGLQIWGEKALKREFDVFKNDISQEAYRKYKAIFLNKYSFTKKTDNFKYALIKPSNIFSYKFSNIDTYVSDISCFERRPNSKDFYLGKKILFPRVTDKSKAVFTEDFLYCNTDVFLIKLKDEDYYHLFAAILNSDIIDYILSISYRKRSGGSFPKIDVSDLLNIPIPQYFDPMILNQINILSREIIDGKYSFEERKKELNELIFDLYTLNAVERRRIVDYHAPDRVVKKKDIEIYCQIFSSVFKIYLNKDIYLTYEYYTNPNLPLFITGVKIIFSNSKIKGSHEIVKQVIFNINYDILEEVGNQNFLSLKGRIYADKSIFIIKDNQFKNWSQSQAYDDAVVELNKLTI